MLGDGLHPYHFFLTRRDLLADCSASARPDTTTPRRPHPPTGFLRATINDVVGDSERPRMRRRKQLQAELGETPANLGETSMLTPPFAKTPFPLEDDRRSLETMHTHYTNTAGGQQDLLFEPTYKGKGTIT